MCMSAPHCSILVEEESAQIILRYLIKIGDYYQRDFNIHVEAVKGAPFLVSKFREIDLSNPWVIIVDRDVFHQRIPGIEEIRDYPLTYVLDPDLEGCYPPWLVVEVINSWITEIRQETPEYPEHLFTRELLYDQIRGEKRTLDAIQAVGEAQFKEKDHDPSGFTLYKEKVELAKRMGKRAYEYGYVPRKMVPAIQKVYELASKEAKKQGAHNIDNAWLTANNNVFLRISKNALNSLPKNGQFAYGMNKRVFGIDLTTLEDYEFRRPAVDGIEYEAPIAWTPNNSQLLIYQSRKTPDNFRGFRIQDSNDMSSKFISHPGVQDDSFASWDGTGDFVYLFSRSNGKQRLQRIQVSNSSRKEYSSVIGDWPVWIKGEKIGFYERQIHFKIYDAANKDTTDILLHKDSIRHPKKSPSKNYIAYESANNGGNPGIYIHNLRTNEINLITPFDEPCRTPEWINDDLIIYTRHRIIKQDDRNSTELWICNIHTGVHQQLTRTKGAPINPCWRA